MRGQPKRGNHVVLREIAAIASHVLQVDKTAFAIG
jgi:hypothetical protein